MKALLAIAFTVACFSQEESVTGTASEFTVSSGTLILSTPVRVEVGGIDSKGKPYICQSVGKCKPASRRKLIQHIKASPLISDFYKAQALAYLGHPINLKVYGEVKK